MTDLVPSDKNNWPDIKIDWKPTRKVGIQDDESMTFMGKPYVRNPEITCQLGDWVIIHPVPGRSQTTKSYPAQITVEYSDKYTINGKHIPMLKLLVLKGRDENINWWGAVINKYAFGRLEFVKRGTV